LEVLSSDDPVTLWIDELRNADEAAARKLWNHFVTRLYELGRKKLRPETRRVYDEQDAAQSAFQSVCAGIAAGRFPDLGSRENLWHLLAVITARKVAHRQRHDKQLRRDVHRNLSDSIFLQSSDEFAPAGVDALLSREPTPEFAAEFVETCDFLFQSLDDPALQQVVTLRMEGYTDDEIADRLKCSRRTVQRRLEVVRRHWHRLELSSG
jgi:RNA polymerase sigma factor (sigma-70 family)